jgi:NAD(P)-dependent dehydrogenase (short-subunit alcohol dehydrogenase family)
VNRILITGSSSGFGLATARLFLDRGWSVVATMRSPQPDLFPVADRLRLLALDVTDVHSVGRAIETAGPIDVLVNNAGAGLMGVHEAVAIDQVRDLFQLNVLGPLAMTRATMPGFREQGSGVIINVSSAVTLEPFPLLSAYTASKSALEAFSESFALEAEPLGVRVRVVLPGRSPQTGFGAKARSRSPGAMPEAYAAWASEALAAVPGSGTAVTAPEDVAEAVWRAATDPAAPFRIPAGPDAVALAREPG